MDSYIQHFNPNKTPQTEQADPRQVTNSAGGFTFAVDKWKRLERFVILGSAEGSYYATARELTRENAKVVTECCAEDGERTVKLIADISEAGRAPKNDAAVFALALASASENPKARAAALAALPRVCRIGTHLFQFVEAVNEFRGWGPALRRAVATWYTSKGAGQVAFQVAKYGQRGGWSHRDVLRLAHPEANLPELATVLRYITTGAAGGGERSILNKKTGQLRKYPDTGSLPAFLVGFEELKHADEKRTIELIGEHGFTHEMIDSRHKNSASVWEALLPKMPLHALLRNLGKMSEVGLLKPLARAVETVTTKLNSRELIQKARLHPMTILSASRVYAQGHGEKGSLTWQAVQPIRDALDAAFYLAFDAVEPTGKRTLLALDVSGSMGSPSGVPGVSCRDASACLAMVTARTEPAYHFFGFSHRFIELPISASMRLAEAVKVIEGLPFESTDCSLPFTYAEQHKLDVDMFAVFTDSETYAGRVHPHQALTSYRRARGINAKSAVVGMVSNGFTIASPDDAGMIDVN